MATWQTFALLIICFCQVFRASEFRFHDYEYLLNEFDGWCDKMFPAGMKLKYSELVSCSTDHDGKFEYSISSSIVTCNTTTNLWKLWNCIMTGKYKNCHSKLCSAVCELRCPVGASCIGMPLTYPVDCDHRVFKIVEHVAKEEEPDDEKWSQGFPGYAMPDASKKFKRMPTVNANRFDD